jgi:tetratricopeptide (TPR) repeat protein
MLVDRFSQEPLDKRLEITASDINSNAVKKAREGSYTSWSFRGAPSWCFAYFQPLSTGLVTLKPSPLRQVLSFEVESCQAGAAARADASLDVLTFRNVAIYLTEPATQALYRDFARILRPGGLLAIGPSDHRPAPGLFEFLDYHDDSPVFLRVSEPQESRPKRTTSGPEPRVIAPTVKARTQNDPSSPRTFHQLRETEVKVAQSAFSVVETLAKSDPDDPLALRILGQAHLSRGEVEDAIRVLRQAVFLAADDALTRYFFALALREAGDVRQAVRQLKNVIATLLPRERKEKLTDQRTDVGDLLSAATFLEEQWT